MSGIIDMTTLRSAVPATAMHAALTNLPEEQQAEIRRRNICAHPLELRAETADEATRSVEAVIATDNEVIAFDLGSFMSIREILMMDGYQAPESGQVPLLESHQRWTTDFVHGSVRSIKPDGRRLLGTLHFADDEPSLVRWRKVRDGHITDLSVGTQPLETEIVRPGQTKRIGGRTITATDRPVYVRTRWTLKETSLTAIGADSNAKIREDLSGREAHSTPGTPGTSGLPGANTRNDAMNEQLRAFLEGIGLRQDATVDDAWSFYRGLDGTNRSAAEAMKGDDQETTPAPAPGNAPAPGTERSAQPPAPLAAKPAAKPAAPPAEREEASQSLAAAGQTHGALRAEGVAHERNRVASIMNMAGADMPRDLVTRALTENWTTERAATEFLTHHRGNFNAPASPNGATGNGVHVGTDRTRDHSTRLLAGGLMLRCGTRFDDPEYSEAEKTEEAESLRQARRFQDMSLLRICEECIRMDNRSVPMSIGETIRAAVATGTLASVFTTSINARLMAAYLEAPDTTDWANAVDVANFMTQERELISPMGGLEKLGRGGTAKMAAPGAGEETYKIARFAKQFVVDEQDIRDDRLDVFQRVPQGFGLAAARLRPDLIYSIILANAALGADSVALFHGTHANLAGAVLAAATLAAGIAAMMKQTHNGVHLNLIPRFVLTPPDLTLTAAELVKSSQIIIAGTAGAITTRGSHNVLADFDLQVRGDGRLGVAGITDPNTGTAYAGSATNWFLVAAHPDTIEVGYLAGTGRRPELRSFILDRGQWGVGWDIKHDIGAKALDFRGMYQGNV